jgi:hypothetical protein
LRARTDGIFTKWKDFLSLRAEGPLERHGGKETVIHYEDTLDFSFSS